MSENKYGTMPDLYSMTEEELASFFATLGEPKFRAKQTFAAIAKGTPISEMTNLSKALRERLLEQTLDTLPRVREKLVSSIDGTVKYLFELHDGSCIESVLMKYKHGNTLCISSQVGCRMGCKFCASTIGGRERNLYPSELLGQVTVAQRDSGERISNIVMMGIGEPLDNYDNVVKFLRLINDEGGVNIGYRHISLSTCGVVPGILRLAEEELPITLSISLHAPTDERRSEIMPVNKKWGVDELLAACVSYYKKTGRRISFEYTLISGKNDTEEDARLLASVLKCAFHGTGAPIHINLIRVNEVKETGFVAGSARRYPAFESKPGWNVRPHPRGSSDLHTRNRRSPFRIRSKTP